MSEPDAPLPDRLAIDTNCFIYFIQDPAGARGDWLRRAVFETAGPDSLVASTMALAELLVGPERQGNPAAARALRDALVSLPRMRWVELDRRIRNGRRSCAAVTASASPMPSSSRPPGCTPTRCSPTTGASPRMTTESP